MDRDADEILKGIVFDLDVILILTCLKNSII